MGRAVERISLAQLNRRLVETCAVLLSPREKPARKIGSGLNCDQSLQEECLISLTRFLCIAYLSLGGRFTLVEHSEGCQRF
jgi:hypothetical protein